MHLLAELRWPTQSLGSLRKRLGIVFSATASSYGTMRSQWAPPSSLRQSALTAIAHLEQNLRELHAHLQSGRYQAPVIRGGAHPQGKRKAQGARHHHDRRSSGAEGRRVGAQRGL